MSRPARLEVVDGWYHVFGRGIERRDIFADERDRGHLHCPHACLTPMHARRIFACAHGNQEGYFAENAVLTELVAREQRFMARSKATA